MKNKDRKSCKYRLAKTWHVVLLLFTAGFELLKDIKGNKVAGSLKDNEAFPDPEPEIDDLSTLLTYSARLSTMWKMVAGTTRL